ncbi:MAG: 6-bladed beta-propeller [Phycisphaerales bacterium]|nr:MAG: 6-bladed beta-propeller [Phycisphaerales bacterium]
MRVLAGCLIVGGALYGCGPSLPPAEPEFVFGETGLGPGEFSYPRAIAVAPDDAVFVVDKSGRIQRFDPDGNVETVWHMPEYAAGKPTGMTVHPDGRLFVADTHYNRVLVFDRDGEELARFGEAGTGPGQFMLPTDVALDASGRIYVSEYGGNDRISRFSPDFEFELSFGGPESGAARLTRPAGMAFDEEGMLWVADACNHRLCRFNPEGKLLQTIGEMGRDQGQLRYPYDIDLLDDGTLVVCEYGNNRLQWFSPTGESLGIWGGAGRRPGQMAYPWGVARNNAGRLYVVDSGNNRVQALKP